MENVVFNFSEFCDPIEKQANEQGYTLGDKAGHIEDLRRALNMVRFYLATESQIRTLRGKLNKKVIKTLKPI